MRCLVIDCAQLYLEALNGNEELRQYLVTYPLGPENIDVTIHCCHSDRTSVSDPFPVTTAAREGKVIFYIEEEGQVFGYKEVILETWDEAVAKVRAMEETENGAD